MPYDIFLVCEYTLLIPYAIKYSGFKLIFKLKEYAGFYLIFKLTFYTAT